MKSLIAVTFSIAAVAALGGLAYFAGQRSNAITATSQGPTIDEIRSLEDLVTARISVSDVLVSYSDSHKGSWLIKGDVLLGINLERAEILEKSADTQAAIIVLPHPHVVIARVDHERTLTWDVKSNSWNPYKWLTGDESPLHDQAMNEAQQLIEKAGSSKAQHAIAKRQAKLVIEKLYKMVGWTVTVRWR